MLFTAIKQIKFRAWQLICFRLPNKTSSFSVLRNFEILPTNSGKGIFLTIFGYSMRCEFDITRSTKSPLPSILASPFPRPPSASPSGEAGGHQVLLGVA